MRFSMIVAACCVLGAGSTQADSLIARDGKTYTGKVEFKAGNQLIVTPASGVTVTVQLEELMRLSMSETPPPAVAPTESDPHLPRPWQQADIGRVKETGSGVEAQGVFTVRGAGWGIWGAADSFHFVYQPFVGDIDVAARVGEPPSEKNPLAAGLTIREGLDPSSVQASLMLYPKGEARMGARPIDGPGQFAPPAANMPYQWVRLVRAGEFFSGFCSPDGESWVPAGTVKVKMGATGYVGLACAATLNEGLVGTTFDHVTVRTQSQGPVEGFGLNDGSVVAGKAKRLDEQVFEFSDRAGEQRTLPAKAVAHIFLRPLPQDMRKAMEKRGQGVFLLNGDVIEGSVQGLKAGRVTLDSVLFGRRTEPLTKVSMVVMRSPQMSSGFSVCTRDGSVYRCTGIRVGEGEVIATSGICGTINVKAADLMEVIRAD